MLCYLPSAKQKDFSQWNKTLDIPKSKEGLWLVSICCCQQCHSYCTSGTLQENTSQWVWFSCTFVITKEIFVFCPRLDADAWAAIVSLFAKKRNLHTVSSQQISLAYLRDSLTHHAPLYTYSAGGLQLPLIVGSHSFNQLVTFLDIHTFFSFLIFFNCFIWRVLETLKAPMFCLLIL